MVGRTPSRLHGVDAARGVALLGMAAVHVLPAEDPDGSLSLTEHVASGRAAATFAVLAGVGLALSARRTGWGPRRRLALLLRAALVGALGLALGALDSGVAVVLASYAVLFVLVQPFLGWRPRPLLLLAVTLALLVPVASQAGRDRLPARDTGNPELDRLAAPGQLLADLLVTGYYPAAAWLTYLLLGLAVGRLDLARQRSQIGIACAGAGAVVLSAVVSTVLLGPAGGQQELEAASGGSVVVDRGFFGNVPTVSWWWLAVDAPHTTTPLDLLGTAGAALLVLGACLVLASRVQVVLAPLAAVGGMPLSLYTAHVVLLGLTEPADPVRYYVLQVLVATAAALAWRRLLGRGPVELLLGAVTGRVAGGQQGVDRAAR